MRATQYCKEAARRSPWALVPNAALKSRQPCYSHDKYTVHTHIQAMSTRLCCGLVSVGCSATRRAASHLTKVSWLLKLITLPNRGASLVLVLTLASINVRLRLVGAPLLGSAPMYQIMSSTGQAPGKNNKGQVYRFAVAHFSWMGTCIF